MEDLHQKVAHAMGLEDETFQRIDRMCRQKRVVKLKDRTGLLFRFYRKDGKLYGHHTDGTRSITRECLNMKEVVEQQQRAAAAQPNEVFREHILPKIRADNPGATEEEINAMADVVAEANGTIKRLMMDGVAPAEAFEMVKAALEGKEITAGSSLPASAE